MKVVVWFIDISSKKRYRHKFVLHYIPEALPFDTSTLRTSMMNTKNCFLGFSGSGLAPILGMVTRHVLRSGGSRWWNNSTLSSDTLSSCELVDWNWMNITVNRYTFMWSNSAVLFFSSIFNLGSTQNVEEFFTEQILSLKSSTHFSRSMTSREVNKRNCSPL